MWDKCKTWSVRCAVSRWYVCGDMYNICVSFFCSCLLWQWKMYWHPELTVLGWWQGESGRTGWRRWSRGLSPTSLPPSAARIKLICLGRGSRLLYGGFSLVRVTRSSSAGSAKRLEWGRKKICFLVIRDFDILTALVSFSSVTDLKPLLSCFQDVHVFALEKESTDAGQRVYLVTSYSELWHYYRWLHSVINKEHSFRPAGTCCASASEGQDALIALH